MAGIDAARKKSMIAYAARAKAIFSRSFNVACLQQGWADCGYFPRNYRRIMSKWTGWTRLSKPQGTLILNSIPELAEISSKDLAGRLDDKVVNEKFDFLPLPPKNVADMGVTRERVCQINAKGFTVARNEQGAVRVQKEAKVAAKALVDAVKIPSTKVMFGPGSSMWKKGAVLVQLQLRRNADQRFTFNKASKTNVLIELWREYDERCANGGGGAPAAVEPAAAPAAAAAVQRTELNVDEIVEVEGCTRCHMCNNIFCDWSRHIQMEPHIEWLKLHGDMYNM